MREIKFEYIYWNWKDFLKKVFTIDEISNWYCYEFLCDMPMYKDYKLIQYRQYTWLKDKNWKEIYEGDVIENKWKKIICFRLWTFWYFDEYEYFYILKDASTHKLSSVSTLLDIEIIWNIYESLDLIPKE